MRGKARLKILLVDPPFGPETPSLALALLSALALQLGHSCDVLHWNLVVAGLCNGAGDTEDAGRYGVLTNANWFPFNEWAFRPALFAPDPHTELRATLGLSRRAIELSDGPATLRALWQVRRQHEALVEEAAQRAVGADVVGISTSYFQNVPALALARRIKKHEPHTQVILGGANCSSPMGEALFDHFDFVDAVFLGEAETTFPAYLDNLVRNRPAPIRSVLQRGLTTPTTPAPLTDLDTLPTPDFTSWLDQRNAANRTRTVPTGVPLEASRGCWWGAKHACAFCGLNADNRTYRQKSLARLTNEVREVERATATKAVFMTDNCMSPEVVRTKTLTSATTRLFFEVRASLRRDELRDLAERGISMVQPGIESFDSDLLRLMNKGTRSATNVEFLRNAMEFGVWTTYNLLYDLPGEDRTWYQSSAHRIPLLEHLMPPNGLVHLQYQRYSEYVDHPGDYGIELRPSKDYSLLYPWSEDQYENLAYLFERTDQVTAQAPGFEDLGRAIGSWRSAYGREPRLEMEGTPDQLVINDTRSNFGPRVVTFDGLAAQVLAALAHRRALPGLLRALRAREFSSTPDEVTAILDALELDGLVWRDDCRDAPTWWVALPLLQHATERPTLDHAMLSQPAASGASR